MKGIEKKSFVIVSVKFYVPFFQALNFFLNYLNFKGIVFEFERVESDVIVYFLK